MYWCTMSTVQWVSLPDSDMGFRGYRSVARDLDKKCEVPYANHDITRSLIVPLSHYPIITQPRGLRGLNPTLLWMLRFWCAGVRYHIGQTSLLLLKGNPGKHSAMCLTTGRCSNFYAVAKLIENCLLRMTWYCLKDGGIQCQLHGWRTRLNETEQDWTRLNKTERDWTRLN